MLEGWEYRGWVEEGLIRELKDPFEAVKWQQVLGGEGFLRKLKDQWNQRAERPKNYGQKKNWSAVGTEQILGRVSEHFQSDLERLKERSIRNNLARRCAIALCWDHAGLSHDEIAARGDLNPILGFCFPLFSRVLPGRISIRVEICGTGRKQKCGLLWRIYIQSFYMCW